MSRFIVCDVCEGTIGEGEPVATLAMPGQWVNAAYTETIDLDVCSAACIGIIHDRLLGDEVPEPEEMAEVTGETPAQEDDEKARGRFSAVPETAQVRYQDPTGVRIKTLGGNGG